MPNNIPSYVRLLASLGLAAAVASSCKDDGEAYFDRFQAINEDVAQFECGCLEARGELADAGYDNVEECVQDGTAFDGFDVECLRGVYNDDAYAFWLDCLLETYEEYQACLDRFGCMPEEFDCGDGTTVPMSEVCDRVEDCEDGRDEQGCEGKPSGCVNPLYTCGFAPPAFEDALDACTLMFACADGSGEVPQLYKCDGDPDCPDGSDEQGCPLTCDDGTMVDNGTRCDGTADCPDGSDEANCSFTCTDGTMIPGDWVCDGEPDCSDGGDEQNC